MAPRVLMLSWEYPPVIEGGLARHVRKLAEALVAAGSEVHVLTRAGRSTGARELRHGVCVHRVDVPPMPADPADLIAWVAAMNAAMLERGERLLNEPFDIVHGHDWLVADAAERLARLAGTPLVVTIHATEHGRHQGWVAQPPQSEIHATERSMAHASDQLIVCSHYMRAHVAEVFGVPSSRVAVIPNGIDAADLQPLADLDRLRARFAKPGEKLVLLIGRLVYEKGFQDALAALAGPEGVIARAGRLRFVIAGSGRHEPELRRQAAALGLDDYGTFLGWIGDDLLHSLYRVADLTVVPSIYEPFGLVALEAMASGCACVVADTGGLREVVPDPSGLRFQSGDAGELARVMERVLTDAELRQRLVTDAERHVQRFDWDVAAASTAARYEALLAVRRETQAGRHLGLTSPSGGPCARP